MENEINNLEESLTEQTMTENDVIEAPVCSTDNVWYKTDMTMSSSEKFDAIDSNIASLQSGKANTNHTHSNYALTTHTHSNYAAKTHTHSDYAAKSHTHNEYAPLNHTHEFPSDFIKSINKSFTLTGSSNSFSIDIDDGVFEEGKTYLFSFSYVSSSNTLLGRSLYAVYYSKSARLVPSYTLVYCNNGTDNAVVAYISNKTRIATSYNGGTAAKCELRVI